MDSRAKRLKEAIEKSGYSYVELERITGISKSSIQRYATGETKKIPIECIEKIAVATKTSSRWIMGWEDKEKPLEPNASIPPQYNVRMVPVYESVSAGFGAHAEDMVTGYMPLYIVSDSEAENTIVIKVQGDSMYPKIENGDSIQVLRQDFADNGQVAVLLIDGEDAVVKQFFHDRKAKTVTLHSFNPDYKDRVFDGIEMTRLRVLGVVKKVIKEI